MSLPQPLTASFSSVSALLADRRPAQPVYCIHPQTCENTAREFVGSFPGRVLYTVKANDHHEIVRLLRLGGVRHFDCASIQEIDTVMRACDDATCYFVVPVRLRGAAQQAQNEYGGVISWLII